MASRVFVGPVRGWLFLVAVGVGSLLHAGPARAQGPAAARWVAPDAAVYVELIRPADLLDRITDPKFQAVAQAVPGYQKGIDNEGFRKLREVASVVTTMLGTTPEQAVRDLTGGGIVLAVEPRPGEKPRVLLLVKPQDPDFLNRAHAKLLELARNDAASKGQPDPVKQADYRGITTFSVGGEEAHAIVASHLVVSSGKPGLQAVIDRALDGEKAGPAINADATWIARRAQAEPDALAFALVRLDRLREVDPKRFKLSEQADPGRVLLVGHWLEAVRHAPWASASVAWTADRVGAQVTVPTPPGGYSEAFRKYLPPAETGGAPAAPHPPGTIATVSLWRDLAAIWEVRADLLPPAAVQNLAKLDSFAGQFFGGRDFGTGVLGSLTGDWRLVIAHQDYDAMNPVPDVKLPAFALVVDLKPGDDDFAQRLRVAFQSFIGLANIGAAQEKAPPLMLGSELFEGVTIATAQFMPPKDGQQPKDAPVHQRHNFSPSAVQVGDHFILSSSLGLARSLVKAMREPREPTDVTLLAQLDPAALARLVEINKPRLVMQNMVEKGNDRAAAEKEVSLLAALLRYFGPATLTAKDASETVQFRLNASLPAH